MSLYEELLSTMFERLLGSSGIVAGEVVPKHNHVIFLSKEMFIVVLMFLAHALSPHRIIFNEISTICKCGSYVETCSMRSNVKAVKIQCKRAPNTSSGKFQRGPAAVKISRYMHHSLRSLRNQQERW